MKSALLRRAAPGQGLVERAKLWAQSSQEGVTGQQGEAGREAHSVIIHFAIIRRCNRTIPSTSQLPLNPSLPIEGSLMCWMFIKNRIKKTKQNNRVQRPISSLVGSKSNCRFKKTLRSKLNGLPPELFRNWGPLISNIYIELNSSLSELWNRPQVKSARGLGSNWLLPFWGTVGGHVSLGPGLGMGTFLSLPYKHLLGCLIVLLSLYCLLGILKLPAHL